MQSFDSCLLSAMVFAVGGYIMFPQMERITNIKQLQLMCGIRSVSYWLVCFLFDYITYLVVVLVIASTILVYGTLSPNAFSGSAEIGLYLTYNLFCCTSSVTIF